MTHRRTVAATRTTFVGALALTAAACAGAAPGQESYETGRAEGCRSGYHDANWGNPDANFMYRRRDGASEDYERGWEEGYRDCFDRGKKWPVTIFGV